MPVTRIQKPQPILEANRAILQAREDRAILRDLFAYDLLVRKCVDKNHFELFAEFEQYKRRPTLTEVMYVCHPDELVTVHFAQFTTIREFENYPWLVKDSPDCCTGQHYAQRMRELQDEMHWFLSNPGDSAAKLHRIANKINYNKNSTDGLNQKVTLLKRF